MNCVDYFGLSFFTFPGELSKNKIKKFKCWLISFQSSLENITIYCVKLININIYTDVSRVTNLCQSSLSKNLKCCISQKSTDDTVYIKDSDLFSFYNKSY